MAGQLINPVHNSSFLELDTFVTKLIRDIEPLPVSTFIDQYIPTRDQPVEAGFEIKWDIEVHDPAFMTPLASDNAPAPMVDGGGARQERFVPPHFRVRHVIKATDFFGLRELGTPNTPQTVGSQITKWTAKLREGIDKRMAWLKWSSIVENAAFTIYGHDLSFEVDYSDYGFHPTPAVNWDVVGATPLDDIIDFVKMFEPYGRTPRFMLYGPNVLTSLMSNSDIRTIITEQLYRNVQPAGALDTITANGVNSLLRSLFGGVEPIYYNEPVFVGLHTSKTSSSNNNALQVYGDLSLFAVDDVVSVIDNQSGEVFEATLSAVNMGVQTIESADFVGHVIHSGSIVRKRFDFTGDKFIMMSDNVRENAELVTVANIHGPGGLENPTTGIAARVIDHSNQDPPTKELIAGFTGGVVVYNGSGIWLAADVLS